jgi:RNA polymerase sigma-70 factor, ECF subfamily
VALNVDKLTELHDLHARAILAFLARRTYDAEAAVDLLAETFAVAIRDRRKFRGSDTQAERAWLYSIARHQLSNYFRSERAELRALTRLGVERRALTDSEYERIEELASSGELRRLVASEIDRLPDDQREAVRLRIVCEETYESIAGALGISQATARARVSRGLRALRTAVTSRGSEHTFPINRSLDNA